MLFLRCFSILGFAIMIALSSDAIAAQAPQIIVEDCLGLATLDKYKEFGEIASTGDTKAVKLFLLQNFDDAHVFHKGERVFLTDVASFGTKGCLRPSGEIKCFWVQVNELKMDGRP